MWVFIFESWDNYDGQHGVAVVTASSEKGARDLMGKKSKARSWDVENELWTLEAEIPSSSTVEAVCYSIYL
jgi:hypothetical protein